MLSRHKLSALEEAFDQNLLASFLLANVLTGLVNLSVDTLFVSSVSALAILQVYAFVLSLAVGFAKFYGIKFKFW
nr:phosphatidylinositol glycan, class W [Ipomoea batatas]